MQQQQPPAPHVYVWCVLLELKQSSCSSGKADAEQSQKRVALVLYVADEQVCCLCMLCLLHW